MIDQFPESRWANVLRTDKPKPVQFLGIREAAMGMARLVIGFNHLRYRQFLILRHETGARYSTSDAQRRAGSKGRTIPLFAIGPTRQEGVVSRRSPPGLKARNNEIPSQRS